MSPLKLKFFSYHLASSLFIVILLSAICQFFWFPSPFLLLDGTWIALATLATIDIIIGPILTLILVSNKKSKRELFLDMFIIVIIQITALSYGFTKIEQERVWAIVHLDGVFNLVPKKEILEKYQKEKQELPQYKGMYYAMGLNSEMGLHSQISNKPLMFSPERYHLLNQRSMKNTAVAYNDLPKEIKNKYNNQHIFKILIGKKHNAIIVLNDKLSIIDILPVDDENIRIPLAI